MLFVFFFALCTQYLCAHSPLLLPAEVIFCHCGLFDHLTHLMLTVFTEKEEEEGKKQPPLSSDEVRK